MFFPYKSLYIFRMLRNNINVDVRRCLYFELGLRVVSRPAAVTPGGTHI